MHKEVRHSSTGPRNKQQSNVGGSATGRAQAEVCGLGEPQAIVERDPSQSHIFGMANGRQKVYKHAEPTGDREAGSSTQIRRLVELDAMEEPLVTLTFEEAFTNWMEKHSPFIGAGTVRVYKQYGDPLLEYFGSLCDSEDRPIKLGAIGPMVVRGYQLWRSKDMESGSPCPTCKAEHAKDSFAHGAANVRIRNEINCVLKPILKEAGLWASIKERKFKHLPVPREGSGSLISREEQREILAVAESSPRWQLFMHLWKVAIHSGCGLGELFRLRRRDVDLEEGFIMVILGAKNDGARMRKVALTPTALESVRWTVSRWERMAGTDRNDFILPHRKLIKRGPPFTRPMASMNRAWMAIRAEWIRRHPGRANRLRLRIYDARVTAAVRLLQNGKLSLPTIKKALGWEPSSAMVNRYYKPEQEMLREAMNTLEDPEPKPKPPQSEKSKDGGVENAG